MLLPSVLMRKKTCMGILLQDGTQIVILIPPQWSEVVEDELWGTLKRAGLVLDFTEAPPLRMTPLESELLDKIITDALLHTFEEGEQHEHEESKDAESISGGAGKEE